MLPKFKRKSPAEWLVLFILAMPFLASALVEFLHLPSMLLYSIDAAWCGLALLLLINWRKFLQETVQVKCLLGVVALFLISTLVGLVLQYQSILYYLWGIRNNFAFFVFFFACVLFLKVEDLDGYLKALDVLFVVNFLVTLFQFFVLGYKQDYLGGIFGVQASCNRQSNVFMMIVITNCVVRYLNQKEKAWVCLLKCAAALFIAALAELKMFILEFGVIIVLAVLLTKFSRRKIFLLVGGCVGAVAAVQILTFIFPGWAGWFSLERIWDTATSAAGYNGQGIEVNRLTVVPIAWNTYLTTWPQKLFGLGLGHCDYASFAFLTTPFYTQYGHILYTWFHSGFLMLETGLVGLILYCAFFLTVFFAAHTLERSGRSSPEHCQLGKIMAILCFALLIYNDTLRNQAAYMVFFTLALPFVQAKNNA